MAYNSYFRICFYFLGHLAHLWHPGCFPQREVIFSLFISVLSLEAVIGGQVHLQALLIQDIPACLALCFHS